MRFMAFEQINIVLFFYLFCFVVHNRIKRTQGEGKKTKKKVLGGFL